MHQFVHTLSLSKVFTFECVQFQDDTKMIFDVVLVKLNNIQQVNLKKQTNNLHTVCDTESLNTYQYATNLYQMNTMIINLWKFSAFKK